MSLEEIAKKHGTLKVQHGYMPIYERFFEPLRGESIIDILEIGVHEGASLRTWCDYFRNPTVLGVDIFLTDKAKEGAGRDSYSLMGCDATRDFRMIRGQWDFIIDDGSHIQTEVQASFNGLWDSLKPGGYYVIEDLFAAYDPAWNPGGPVFLDHIQSRLKNILIGGDEIQECHWFGRNDINGILFLRKRYEAFRIQPLTEFQ